MFSKLCLISLSTVSAQWLACYSYNEKWWYGAFPTGQVDAECGSFQCKACDCYDWTDSKSYVGNKPTDSLKKETDCGLDECHLCNSKVADTPTVKMDLSKFESIDVDAFRKNFDGDWSKDWDNYEFPKFSTDDLLSLKGEMCAADKMCSSTCCERNIRIDIDSQVAVLDKVWYGGNGQEYTKAELEEIAEEIALGIEYGVLSNNTEGLEIYTVSDGSNDMEIPKFWTTYTPEFTLEENGKYSIEYDDNIKVCQTNLTMCAGHNELGMSDDDAVGLIVGLVFAVLFCIALVYVRKAIQKRVNKCMGKEEPESPRSQRDEKPQQQTQMQPMGGMQQPMGGMQQPMGGGMHTTSSTTTTSTTQQSNMMGGMPMMNQVQPGMMPGQMMPGMQQPMMGGMQQPMMGMQQPMGMGMQQPGMQQPMYQ